eukprot:3733961-Heterocapsa_arctica.AAC.1
MGLVVVFKRPAAKLAAEMASDRLAMMAIIGKLPGYRSLSAGLKFAGVPNGLAVIFKAARQLEERPLSLSLDWRLLDEKTEADDLSNSDFSGVKAENRRSPSLTDLRFSLWPDLLKHGAD